MKKPIKIHINAIRRNPNGKLGLLWQPGGAIIIDDSYIKVLGMFNEMVARFKIGETRCYRDRKEELLVLRIVRMTDDTQDFSIQFLPTSFEKFVAALNEKTPENGIVNKVTLYE